jgi:hypothetical protein
MASLPCRPRTPWPLLLTLVACRSGDGDGPAIQVGFDDAVSSWQEGTETLVTVRLSAPEPLGADLLVEVVDRGSGSASAGLDYAPAPSTPVLFPAGSPDGAAQAIRIALVADGLFEGLDETIDLVLQRDAASPVDARLGLATHQVRIGELDRVEVAFLTTDQTVVENLAPHHAIQVRLTSPTGSTLADPVQVVLADTRAGTATAGVDYHFPQRTLVFPAVDGVASAPLDPVDDGLVEAEETVLLTLDALTAGVAVVDPLLLCHLTDGLAPTPLLMVRSGDTSYPATADLVLVPAGPLAPSAEIDLYNLGDSDLRLGFPHLEGDARDFRIEWIESVPFGLVRDGAPRLDWESFLALAADPAALPARVQVSVAADVAGSGWLDLRRREPVRPPAPGRRSPVVYAGSVGAHPGSQVFVQGSPSGFLGRLEDAGRVLELKGDGTWAPIELQPTTAPCHTAPGDEPPLAPGVSRGGSGPSGLPLLRLAIETDTAYAERFPDAQAASDYAEGLVAATREILRRDVGFDLELVYLGLWTEGIDPWVTPDAGGTALGLLDEFRTRWRRDGPPVEADLYHFLSGAVFDGGVAELATYCIGAYGVSTGIHGGIDWESYDGTAGFLTGDLGLFVHELGHNLGARHTQDHCPPLDRCVGNCLGEVLCGRGTLMSYCALCGGWALVDLRMHAGTSSEVRDLAEFSCRPDALLPAGHRMRLRLTHEFDPLSPNPAPVRKAILHLRGEGLGVSGELALGLQASDVPVGR